MPLTRNTPKALIDLGNGMTLLESQLQSVRESGVIDEVVIVTGYLAEQIDAKLTSYVRNEERIRTIYNPFYDVTNNFVSLWLLMSEMNDDDFMITNGDNLFAPTVFRDFVEQNPSDGIYLSAVVSDTCGTDDMKIVYEEGILKRVSKNIPVEDAHAESPGLVLVRGSAFRRLFRAQVDCMARNKQYLDGYWLEVFNRLTSEGVDVLIWHFPAELWCEVDIHVDLEQVRELVKRRIEGFDWAADRLGTSGEA